MTRRPRIPLLPAWVRWAGVACVAGFILYASVIDPPSRGVPSLGPFGVLGLDKYLHFAAYAGLGAAVGYALGNRPRQQVVLGAVLAAGAFGLGIELVQAPLPYRSFDLVDALTNVAGATVAALAWGAIRPRIRFRRVEDPLSSGPLDRS